MDKRHFVSLRVKITIAVILICLGISALAVLSMRQIAGTMIDKEYGDKAEQISKAVATTLDPKEVHAIRDTVLNIYKSIPENKVVTSEDWGSEEWNEYMAHYVGIDQTPTFLKLRDQLRSYQDIYGVNCIYLVYYKTSIRLSLYLVDAAYEGDCPPGVYDNFEDGIWPGEKDIVIPASLTNEEVYGWLVTG
ncbi:MAG: hypothetical protein J5489_04795, partial [Lachnospiraceae bacterium]|nr:hypothetical protein [Lachnospiraceae bacterium]